MNAPLGRGAAAVRLGCVTRAPQGTVRRLAQPGTEAMPQAAATRSPSRTGVTLPAATMR